MVMVFIITLIVSFGFSLAVTSILVPLFSLIAFKYNIIDQPDGIVKIHKKPTPYLGGLAVYIGFLTTIALIFPLNGPFFLILVGSTLLLFIGLIDDLIVLKPGQKFLAQMLVVFCFIKSGLYVKTHFFTSFLNIFISTLWCLTVINAFNLVDVMDGLAAIIAAGITMSMMIIALYYGHIQLALWLLIFLGAIIAFLRFNYPPATIYLGDSGSLFLGGFLAPIPFLFNWGTYNQYGYLTPVIIYAVPLIEVVTLVVVRSYKKIPFYKPSPDHFCLYLKKNGWALRTILGYIVILSAIQLGIAFLFLNNYISLAMFFGIAGASVSLWYAVLIKIRFSH